LSADKIFFIKLKPAIPVVPNSNITKTMTENAIIGIDPGHEGIDSGTKAGNILEKDINLIFSQMVK